MFGKPNVGEGAGALATLFRGLDPFGSRWVFQYIAAAIVHVALGSSLIMAATPRPEELEFMSRAAPYRERRLLVGILHVGTRNRNADSK